ncbi:MAG: hypothetical protein IMZ53_11650, partial [Thermoplasmata archaeon]|nr:hypothetical protein [Thermoplasmata archaeon]
MTLTDVDYRARYKAKKLAENPNYFKEQRRNFRLKKLAEDPEYFNKCFKEYHAKNKENINALQRAG